MNFHFLIWSLPFLYWRQNNISGPFSKELCKLFSNIFSFPLIRFAEFIFSVFSYYFSFLVSVLLSAVSVAFSEGWSSYLQNKKRIHINSCPSYISWKISHIQVTYYTVRELELWTLKLTGHVAWRQEMYTNFWWTSLQKVVTWKSKEVGRHHWDESSGNISWLVLHVFWNKRISDSRNKRFNIYLYTVCYP
jgi:hypothetical protein